ncbi:MAG: hypothetical protein ABR549_15065 [Mycobacteriales bacterium]
MGRFLAVGGLVAAMLTGTAAPAGATLTSNTFSPSGGLTAKGRVATVSVLLGCTAPGSVRFTVTLTQGASSGVGHGGGKCTGQTETFTVRVPADGAGAFTAGPAQVCGHAVNQEPGGTQDTRDWCRSGGITLHAS